MDEGVHTTEGAVDDARHTADADSDHLDALRGDIADTGVQVAVVGG